MRQVGVIESSKFERTLIHLAGPLENAVSPNLQQCSEPLSAFPPPHPAQLYRLKDRRNAVFFPRTFGPRDD